MTGSPLEPLTQRFIDDSPIYTLHSTERILKSAAEGERNRERLREAALRDLAA